MKKITRLSVLFMLFSSTAFISCDTESADPVLLENIGGETPAGPAVFKVDFSGETHTAIQATAKYEQGTLSIAGVLGTNAEFVSLSIDGTAVKTYNEALIAYYPNASNPTGYLNLNPANNQNNGQVVITEVDTVNNTVSGTFSFTGYYVIPDSNMPSVVFTNGIFENVPVTGLPQNGGGNPVNQKLFKAKVDGVSKDFGVIMPMQTAGILVLGASNVATQESISIHIPEDIAAGTYDLETFSDYYASFISIAGVGFDSDTGTLTITSNTGGWIKGTFSFSGVDFDDAHHTVTNGEFSVEY